METQVPDFNMLRPEELAKILRLSKQRIYQLARAGKIPCIQIDKSVRFLVEDVKTFIAEHRREKQGA